MPPDRKYGPVTVGKLKLEYVERLDIALKQLREAEMEINTCTSMLNHLERSPDETIYWHNILF